MEYNNRKSMLTDTKKNLMDKLKIEPQNKLLISKELMSIDYQLKENEKFYVSEEKKIDQTTSIRGDVNKFSQFKFEDWMNTVIEINLVDNYFDFSKALRLIQYELKTKNVECTEMLNELALRTKWTEIEQNMKRKQFETSDGSQSKGVVECDYEDESVKFLFNKVSHFNEHIKGLEESSNVTHIFKEAKYKETPKEERKIREENVVKTVSKGKNSKNNGNNVEEVVIDRKQKAKTQQDYNELD